MTDICAKIEIKMEHQRVNTFVLKTYQEKHAESYYRAECQTLRCLKRNAGSSKNIVNFLGNFEYLDTFNLLFEYADRGSLEHFITNRQNLPPASGRDIARFWAAFLEVADGLRLIHTLPRPGEEASSCLFRYSTCHVRVYLFTGLILKTAGTTILSRPTFFFSVPATNLSTTFNSRFQILELRVFRLPSPDITPTVRFLMCPKIK